MKILPFVMLLELKKLLSVVVEVDHSMWQSSDGEMIVFAHFGFLCPGVALLLLRDIESIISANR